MSSATASPRFAGASATRQRAKEDRRGEGRQRASEHARQRERTTEKGQRSPEAQGMPGQTRPSFSSLFNCGRGGAGVGRRGITSGSGDGASPGRRERPSVLRSGAVRDSRSWGLGPPVVAVSLPPPSAAFLSRGAEEGRVPCAGERGGRCGRPGNGRERRRSSGCYWLAGAVGGA